MPDAIDAARKLIADRLVAIEAEAGKLRRALASMGESDGAASAAPKPRRRRRPGKHQRRAQAPRGRRREQLLAAIGANPGTRPSGLAAEIGISPSQVSAVIVGLRKEKLVVKEGAGYALEK